ncbi:hypothetical protein ATANTOWER_015403 [Ataeniobius toweri]|uniref:Uncharacterized protein n=1 Tax=Ataeniobius toweri TaxID=208326 RepID=A0ABU7AYT4_9TELE|nr:hypothetical protein [Ataeniobius toweri]
MLTSAPCVWIKKPSRSKTTQQQVRSWNCSSTASAAPASGITDVAKLVRWLGSGSPTSIRSASFADLHTAGSILPSHRPSAGLQTGTTWNGRWPSRYPVFC